MSLNFLQRGFQVVEGPINRKVIPATSFERPGGHPATGFKMRFLWFPW